MTWVFWGVAAFAASANWWSRWSDHRATELWSKPLTLVALIGVALVIDPANPTMRWWFVGALVLSLAGDVLLLGDQRWFVGGLAAFLAAHLAYSAGFLASPDRRWWLATAAVLAAGVLAGSLGRVIVAGASDRASGLALPVAAYLVVISSMLVIAALAGNTVALVGAALFVTSDTVLGWRQFVRVQRWMPVAIMVTYHLAQACLVASLLW
jgi:uncharacterized membrane protein YhhN